MLWNSPGWYFFVCRRRFSLQFGQGERKRSKEKGDTGSVVNSAGLFILALVVTLILTIYVATVLTVVKCSFLLGAHFFKFVCLKHIYVTFMPNSIVHFFTIMEPTYTYVHVHVTDDVVHSCQPSWNGWDSPGILGLVPVVSRLR